MTAPIMPLLYTGGPLATHAYLIPNAAGTAYLCVDAPDGLAAELRENGIQVEALLLTHGHSDHVGDAARVARNHACPVYIHAEDLPLLGREKEGTPIENVLTLPVERGEAADWHIGGRDITLFHVPGHTSGSVAFYEPALNRVFGGDVIFAGGIGRCRSPALREELLSGIGRWLLPLPDATEIYPGHGPSTRLGIEKKEPYFAPYLPAREFTQPSTL
jgi:hydroxyacylglutathione hydrolase